MSRTSCFAVILALSLITSSLFVAGTASADTWDGRGFPAESSGYWDGRGFPAESSGYWDGRGFPDESSN